MVRGLWVRWMSKRDAVVSFRPGVLRRGVAALSCVAVMALAGCSGGGAETDEASKETTARESSSVSGPKDPRLQGESLTFEQAREELCDQIVGYFPDKMVTDVSTAADKEDTSSTCEIDGIEVDSGGTVKFSVSTVMLAASRSVEEIDANLSSDEPMCDKVLFSSEGFSRFLDVHDPRSYGERPDEYCGIKFADEGHMSTRFVENAQTVVAEMWLEPPDSVDQYDVREEIMPYIMEGVKEFHSDR